MSKETIVYRVIVTGSTIDSDPRVTYGVLDMVQRTLPPGEQLTIVQNGAGTTEVHNPGDDPRGGVDAHARAWARAQHDAGVDVDEETIPWDPEDTPIGERCSATMVGRGADLVVALPTGGARGTRHVVHLARRPDAPIGQTLVIERVQDKSLCIVVTGAGLACDVVALVDLAVLLGWDVQVLATPMGFEFLGDAADAAIWSATGRPVRTTWRRPDDGSPRARPADAIVVVPATANTVCKWSAGHTDNLALGVLTEATGGRRARMLAVPCWNRSQDRHPAVAEAIDRLTRWGVRIVQTPTEPHELGTADQAAARFPWHAVLAALSPAPEDTGIPLTALMTAPMTAPTQAEVLS